MLRGQIDRRMLAGVVTVGCVLIVAFVAYAAESDPRILSVVAGLIVTILAGTQLKPKTLVTAVIIVSGMTYIQLPVGEVNLRLDTALVPACLFSCLVHGHMSAFNRQFRRPEIRLLAVFLAMNYAASFAFSPNKASSLNICIWLTLNLVIVAMALTLFEDDKQALYRRMYVSMFIVLVTGIIGWALAAKTGITIGVDGDPTQGLRARGIAFEPNVLAGGAAIWTLILLTQQGRLRRSQWLFVVLAIALIPLTSTRAALLALAAGLGISLLRTGTRALRLVPVALAAIVVLGVVQLTSPRNFTSIAEKFGNLGFTNQTSTYRLDAWRIAAGEISGADWLTGKGTNSFGQRHLDPTRPGEHLPYYLGNLPLATLYDIGLIGVAVLVSVALVLVLRKGPDRHRIRRAAVLVTFLLLSIGTSPFFFSEYWLFIALALARPRVAALRPAEVVWPGSPPGGLLEDAAFSLSTAGMPRQAGDPRFARQGPVVTLSGSSSSADLRLRS